MAKVARRASRATATTTNAFFFPTKALPLADLAPLSTPAPAPAVLPRTRATTKSDDIDLMISLSSLLEFPCWGTRGHYQVGELLSI